jgi:sensor histidine kinase YesM
MNEHFAVDIPALEGAKYFFIPILIRIVLFTATIAISVISFLQRVEKENQRIKNELKSEKLDMELRLLKSQMTPHFLFNALNNIYSLVYTKDNNAPQSVLKLSDMLRYVMVDCQVDMISIDKEIKYMDAFIGFQQMSMENKSNVIFEKKIDNHDFKIPPMILQPLVENSFKHSRLVSDPNGFVHFYLIQENNGLMFIARNSIKGMSLSVVDQNKKTHSGIGLENVKKRLELYYGNNYSFEAKQEDDKYVVTIKIGEKYNEKNV